MKSQEKIDYILGQLSSISSVEEFCELHGLRYNISECGYNVSLNYNQIKAKEGDISDVCRGLVLQFDSKIDPNKKPKWREFQPKVKVIARPFDRFYNYGQQYAKATFNEKTKIYEKKDGTLIILYFDPRKELWRVATRSIPDANVPIDGFGKTFGDLFAETVCAFPENFQKKCKEVLNIEFTYMFELTTPENTVVIQHENKVATLLGVRHTRTGFELNPENWDIEFFKRTQHCPKHDLRDFDSLEEVISFVAERDPLKFEGVVICDENFNRIKIKNSDYVAYCRGKDAIASPRGIAQLVLNDKIDDFYPMATETVRGRIDAIREKIRANMEAFEMGLLEVAGATENAPKREARKAFAIACQEKNLWMGPAMMIFSNKISSLQDYIDMKRANDGTFPNSFLDKMIEG